MRVLLICNYKPGVGGISGQVEILQRKLREEGHTADIFSTKGSFLWRLGLFCRLRKVAKEYDVLHIHCCSGWGFLPAVVGVTVGRWLKKRIVLTYHGGGGEKFFDKHPKLVRYYLTRTDVNIVLSGFLGKVFDQHQLPYTIIPNIIELDGSHYRERTEINPHFICTRAHETLYNIPCILRAFQKTLTKISEVTLTLVGDGSEHENLIQMAKDMGLKNVTFTGRVDNKEIYHHLDQADILLSSPTIDNMPVSLLEAMNVGLLVISSNVGGVPYMVEDGKTGYLFPNNDSDTLAELMIKAVLQPSESIAIIHNAHQAVNAYRWENIRQQLYTAYGISA
ncbi:MAG: glycosyltransferase family 4 protein [Bacteroidales bacterium]|nr:glycosyltransferase family 4 protein [Bacteroidales bacterium]